MAFMPRCAAFRKTPAALTSLCFGGFAGKQLEQYRGLLLPGRETIVAATAKDCNLAMDGMTADLPAPAELYIASIKIDR
jgi:hypothetical protein